MKIVFLQDDFPPESAGGAGMVAGSLAREFKQRGYEVSVVSATQKRENEGKSEWEGVPVYRVYSKYHERWRAWRSLNNPAAADKVSKILNDLKPDIVHAHNVHYHLSYASFSAAKRSGARVFLTAHDAMLISYGKLPPDGQTNWLSELKRAKLRYNPLRNFFIRRALKNVDHTFAVSSALEAALKRSGVRVDDVVYNGIDEKEWRADAKIIESFVATHVLEGRKPIFFGGRISDQKGGSAALEALSIVAAKIPEAVLLVAGRENAYMQKLQARAESLGISKNLVPIGWLSGSELRAAYHASRAVIIPSLYLDPLPTVALEAMACKKPVVASRNGGLPEIVADGQTGLIADPANPSAFAEAIASLLLDEHTAKALGEKGYERASELFSFDAETAKLLSWYEK